jgi:hypothetical protein
MNVSNVAFAICKIGKFNALFLFDSLHKAIEYFDSDVPWNPTVISVADNFNISNFKGIKIIPLPVDDSFDLTSIRFMPHVKISIRTTIFEKFLQVHYATYVRDTKQLLLSEYFEEELNRKLEVELSLLDHIKNVINEEKISLRDFNEVIARRIYKLLKESFSIDMSTEICQFYFEHLDFSVEDEEDEESSDLSEEEDSSDDSDLGI